LILLRE